MTFDFTSTEESSDDAKALSDSAFTEEEWIAIDALSEPGAIF